MTFNEIRAAIEVRASKWTMGNDTPPVAYDGFDVATGMTAPWVRLSILDGDSFTACIGDKPEPRRTGIIMLEIYTDVGGGSAEARKIADSLAAHFEYWQQDKLSTNAGRVIPVPAETDCFRLNFSIGFEAG